MGELVKVERPLRVLVVDDSSLYRQMLMRSLAEVDGVEVIADEYADETGYHPSGQHIH